jgi:hypothetical protein
MKVVNFTLHPFYRAILKNKDLPSALKAIILNDIKRIITDKEYQRHVSALWHQIDWDVELSVPLYIAWIDIPVYCDVFGDHKNEWDRAYDILRNAHNSRLSPWI